MNVFRDFRACLLPAALLIAALAGCTDSMPVVGGRMMDATVDLTCASPQTACGSRCVTVAEDPDNCGACGNVCPRTQVCVAGACVAGCPSGQRLCGGRCVTVETDRANCGACGNACSTGQVCSMGACGLECAPGLQLCAGGGDAGVSDGGADGGGVERFCANTRTDRANCGSCGNACAAGQICESGMCVVSCGGGLTSCSGVCRDMQTDRANCGACGNACAAGQVCSGGSCQTSCTR